MNRLALLAPLSALALFAFAAPAAAQDKPLTKGEVETIVRDYLKDNPQVVIDAITTFQQQQQVAEAKAESAALKESHALLHDKAHPFAGNPEGDVTVVEFFDYNCGYCKRAIKDVLALVEQDKNVRVNLIDLPVLGPDSILAARWALAAQEQGKYFEYHTALMSHPGHVDSKVLEQVAKTVGLDVEKLRKSAESGEEVQKRMEKNIEMSFRLGLRGTPAFIVGETLAKGYIGIEALKQAVSETRAAQKAGGKKEGAP